MRKILMRRRDAAEVLGVSEAQILKWEARGLLHAIDLKGSGGIRAKRLDAREVEALAKSFIDAARAERAETGAGD
jgi:transposase